MTSDLLLVGQVAFLFVQNVLVDLLSQDKDILNKIKEFSKNKGISFFVEYTKCNKKRRRKYEV